MFARANIGRLCGHPPGSLIAAFLLVAATNSARADQPLLGDSLLSQGAFERWDGQGKPEGWTVRLEGAATVAPDDRVRLEGARSLRLEAPRARAVAAVESAPTPCSPGLYHVRIGYRAEDLSRTQEYAGCGALVGFVDWLGAENRVLGSALLLDEYYPRDWCYRDQILTAPPGAAAARVRLSLELREKITWPSTAWLDDVALRPYVPPSGLGTTIAREWSASLGKDILRTPGAVSWFYLAGESERTAVADRVPDPEASLGAALQVKPSTPAYALIFASPYTHEQPAGLYRAFFRVKAPPQPPADPETPLIQVDVDSSLYFLRGVLRPTHRRFRTPGRYEDLELDFVKPGAGWLSFRVFSTGKGAEVRVDHIRVVQLRRFSDPDLLAWYPGFAGLLGSDLDLERGPRTRALVVEGLLSDAFRLDAALGGLKDWEIVRVPYVTEYGGPKLEGFPTRYADLRSARVVVLANAGLQAVGPEGRLQLSALVRNGAGLLVLGGKAAYGGGGLRGSFVEEALPVEIADTLFDLQREKGLLRTTNGGVIGDAAWPADLACPFLHQVTLKPAATVAARAGEAPFLVCGTFGQGRVACVLGGPYASPWPDRRGFTEWEKWPEVLRRLLVWLGGGGKHP